MRNKNSHIPKHKFDIKTWQSVIPGRFLKKCENEELYSSIVVAAMSVESVKKRVDSTKENKESIILVVGNRDECIQYAIDKNIDAIIVTGMDEKTKLNLDYKNYKGLIYLSYEDTAETTRLIRLTSPIKSFEYNNFNMVNGSELFDNAKKLMMSKGYRCLAVCDENSKYSGFVTRRNFLEKPFHKFILVDHNENEQAISGIEECQIMEIIDHHRIAMEKTKYPIFLYAEPVGSTCTIVYEMYKKNSIKPDYRNAILMQGGIISDTVNLKSPTTTDSDRRAIEELEKITKVSRDKISDILSSVAVKFENLKTKESILTDFKKYKERSTDFAIAQCEVPNLPLNPDNTKFDDFINELNNIKSEHKLDWVMLMISDGNTCSSVLISTTFPNCEKFQYKKIRNNVWECEGVISRKKQLLPEIIRTFED